LGRIHQRDRHTNRHTDSHVAIASIRANALHRILVMLSVVSVCTSVCLSVRVFCFCICDCSLCKRPATCVGNRITSAGPSNLAVVESNSFPSPSHSTPDKTVVYSTLPPLTGGIGTPHLTQYFLSRESSPRTPRISIPIPIHAAVFAGRRRGTVKHTTLRDRRLQ